MHKFIGKLFYTCTVYYIGTGTLYMKILHFNHSSSDSYPDPPDLAISDPHLII
jgi:hypothetical protein